MATAKTRKPTNISLLKGRSELVMVAIVAVIATILLVGSLNMEVLGTSVPGPDFIPLILAIVMYAIAAIYLVIVFREPEIHEDDIIRPHNFSPDMLYDLAGIEELDDTHRFPPSEFFPVPGSDDPSVGGEPRVGGPVRPGIGAVALERKAELDGVMTLEEAEASPRRIAVFSDFRSLLGSIAATLVFALALPYVGWVIGAAALFWLITYFLGSKSPVFDLAIALIFSSVIQLVFSGLLGLNLPAGFFGGF